MTTAKPTKKELDFHTKHDFSMPEIATKKTKRGINRHIINTISNYKNEAQWMRTFRQNAYKIFTKKKMPTWGPDLSAIDFDDIVYFLRATDKRGHSWEELPQEIRETYDRIGVPEHEKNGLPV